MKTIIGKGGGDRERKLSETEHGNAEEAEERVKKQQICKLSIICAIKAYKNKNTHFKVEWLGDGMPRMDEKDCKKYHVQSKYQGLVVREKKFPKPYTLFKI